VAHRFIEEFRRFFIRGLAAMLPTILTLTIVIYVLTFVDKFLGRHVNHAVQWVVVQMVCLIEGRRLTLVGDKALWWAIRDSEHSVWDTYYLWLIGFVLAFVLIYVFGRFVASFLGRSLWRSIEGSFFRMPVVKGIYPAVKQVTDFLLAERKMEFSRVVAVEYPRKGIWSVGLVTSDGMRTIQDAIEDDLVTVFVPSSPTPVTGYTITVRRSEIIDLPLSIDDALRFTISGGVIMPPGQVLSQREIRRIRRGLFPPPQESKEIPT